MSSQKLTEKEQEKLNKELFNAVCRNNLFAVKAVIEAGADVNAKDSNGDSLLSKIMLADIKFLKYLLEAGADPDIQDNNGWTALHKASSYGHINKVRFLLKHKADIYKKNNRGRTPFDISLLRGSYDIVELFISAGYTPSERDMQKIKNYRLFKAVKENDLSAVKEAMADGADVNTRDNNGSPLLLKTALTNIEILRYLLENGADSNIRDNYNESLLHMFTVQNSIDSVKLILEFNPNTSVSNWIGETPFAKAIRWERYDTAELFVMNGYVPSDKDFDKAIDITKQERESLKAHFKTLAAQVQEHKAKLIEETESQEFSYADEIIEI